MAEHREPHAHVESPTLLLPGMVPGAGPFSVALALWMLPWEMMAATMAAMAIQPPSVPRARAGACETGESDGPPPPLRMPPEPEAARWPALFG
ncbi:hypothetical protein [Sphingobium aquiterrae]|uniref:hypothetical protein n=1 Tax=Sphingobium aquiterrae TaxID=2038656 RepID=UPI00301B4BCF